MSTTKDDKFRNVKDIVKAHEFPEPTSDLPSVDGYVGIINDAIAAVAQKCFDRYGSQNETAKDAQFRKTAVNADIWRHPLLTTHFKEELFSKTIATLYEKVIGKRSELKRKAKDPADTTLEQHTATSPSIAPAVPPVTSVATAATGHVPTPKQDPAQQPQQDQAQQPPREHNTSSQRAVSEFLPVVAITADDHGEIDRQGASLEIPPTADGSTLAWLLDELNLPLREHTFTTVQRPVLCYARATSTFNAIRNDKDVRKFMQWYLPRMNESDLEIWVYDGVDTSFTSKDLRDFVNHTVRPRNHYSARLPDRSSRTPVPSIEKDGLAPYNSRFPPTAPLSTKSKAHEEDTASATVGYPQQSGQENRKDLAPPDVEEKTQHVQSAGEQNTQVEQVGKEQKTPDQRATEPRTEDEQNAHGQEIKASQSMEGQRMAGGQVATKADTPEGQSSLADLEPSKDIKPTVSLQWPAETERKHAIGDTEDGNVANEVKVGGPTATAQQLAQNPDVHMANTDAMAQQGVDALLMKTASEPRIDETLSTTVQPVMSTHAKKKKKKKRARTNRLAGEGSDNDYVTDYEESDSDDDEPIIRTREAASKRVAMDVDEHNDNDLYDNTDGMYDDKDMQVELTCGTLGDSDDVREEALLQYQQILADLACTTQLTPERLEQYCYTFDVTHGQLVSFDRNVHFAGYSMKEYQRFVAWWIKVAEGEIGELLNVAGGRVGGICALEPGLGKTRIWLTSHMINQVLHAMERRVAQHPKGHLPPNAPAGSKCPSAAHVRGLFRMCCVCEPAMAALRASATTGMMVLVAPPPLMGVWPREQTALLNPDEKVEQEIGGIKVPQRLKQLGVEQPILSIAHRHVESGQNFFNATFVSEHGIKPTTPSWGSWRAANPRLSEDDLKIAIADGRSYNTPSMIIPDNSQHIVVTTPLSIKPHFIEHIKSDTVPRALTRTKHRIPCDHHRRCKNKGNCTSQTHEWTMPKLEITHANIGTFVLDESHQYSGQGTGFRSLLVDLVRAQHFQDGSHITIWSNSGTPMPDSPSNPLALWNAQEVSTWKNAPELTDFTGPNAKRMQEYDAMMVKVRKGETPLVATFNAEFPGTTRPGPAKMNHWLKLLGPKHNEIVLTPMRQLLDKILIRLEQGTTVNGKPLVTLPPSHYRTRQSGMSQEMGSKLQAHVSQYVTNQSTFARLKEEYDAAGGKPGKRKLGQDGKELSLGHQKSNLELQGRFLMVAMTFPYIVEICKGQFKGMLTSKHIKDSGWWDAPEKSPFWEHAAKLLETSPKAQYVLERVKGAEACTTNVVYGEYGTSKVHTLHHREGLIFACHEACVAFLLYLVLKHEMGSAANNIGVMRAESPISSLVRRFQLDRDIQPVEVDQHIDVLILCTRVGSAGITLHRARDMTQVDVDPEYARELQTRFRIHRLGQKATTTITQLVTTTWGIESKVLKRRDQVKQSTSAVMAGTDSKAHESSSASGAKDAVKDEAA